MRAADSRDSTRLPDGEAPWARWVRPNARRSLMVPIGVAPAGAQVSGSMNMTVCRAPPVAGSGKWPTAVLRRIAFCAEVHAVHANRREHVVLEEVVVGSASYGLKYAPGDNHASV